MSGKSSSQSCDSFDAVFVGGGVIGLASAWRAAQGGARVCVLERAEPPAGATNVAAGMLAPVGELSFGEPELLKMMLAAAELWPEFVAELEAASGMATGHRRNGALVVALDRDEAGELRRRHELQQELGLETEWLTPRRCRELEPGLTTSFVGGVLGARRRLGRSPPPGPRPGRRAARGRRRAPHRHRSRRRPLGRRAPRRRPHRPAARPIANRLSLVALWATKVMGLMSTPTRSCSATGPGRDRRPGCRRRRGRRCGR